MTVMRAMTSVLGLAVATAFVLMAAGAAQAEEPKHSTVLGGKGAPQSEFCKSVGGTESGNFCNLESGDSCDSMTLMRGEGCKGPDGEMIPLEEDFGSNMAPEDQPADDTSGDDAGADTGDTVGADDAGTGGDDGGDSSSE
jgi:hypothetical protein